MSNEATNVGLHTMSFGAEKEGVRDTNNGAYPNDIEPERIAETFDKEGALSIPTAENTKEQYPIYRANMKKREGAKAKETDGAELGQ